MPDLCGLHASPRTFDRVALCNYNIDPVRKTAQKTAMRPIGVESAHKIAADVSVLDEARNTARRTPNAIVEDLGMQYMGGLTVQGVRVTTTIPGGAIGNDIELQSVTERWYSNDIHALVKTVTNDPRSGLYTYELTNIVRAAPDPALFQIPAGYTVTTIDNRRTEARRLRERLNDYYAGLGH